MRVEHSAGSVELDLAGELRTCPPEQLPNLLELAGFNDFLDCVYVTLLNRAFDAEGLATYAALAATGLGRPAIVRRVLRSREHRLNMPEARGIGVEEFVNRAYQLTLSRWPDADGLQTYARIAGRWGGRKKVLRNLAASPEARRLNGGRYARIVALRRYAGAAPILRMPLLGWWFTRRQTRELRLKRIELQLAQLGRQLSRQQSLLIELEGAGSASPGLPLATTEPGSTELLFRQALARAAQDRLGRLG